MTQILTVFNGFRSEINTMIRYTNESQKNKFFRKMCLDYHPDKDRFKLGRFATKFFQVLGNHREKRILLSGELNQLRQEIVTQEAAKQEHERQEALSKEVARKEALLNEKKQQVYANLEAQIQEMKKGALYKDLQNVNLEWESERGEPKTIDLFLRLYKENTTNKVCKSKDLNNLEVFVGRFKEKISKDLLRANEMLLEKKNKLDACFLEYKNERSLLLEILGDQTDETLTLVDFSRNYKKYKSDLELKREEISAKIDRLKEDLKTLKQTNLSYLSLNDNGFDVRRFFNEITSKKILLNSVVVKDIKTFGLKTLHTLIQELTHSIQEVKEQFRAAVDKEMREIKSSLTSYQPVSKYLFSFSKNDSQNTLETALVSLETIFNQALSQKDLNKELLDIGRGVKKAKKNLKILTERFSKESKKRPSPKGLNLVALGGKKRRLE